MIGYPYALDGPAGGVLGHVGRVGLVMGGDGRCGPAPVGYFRPGRSMVTDRNRHAGHGIGNPLICTAAVQGYL